MCGMDFFKFGSVLRKPWVRFGFEKNRWFGSVSFVDHV